MKVSGSKRNAKKDPNKPKRPPTAYFVFLEEFRKGFKKENSNSKNVVVAAKACGGKWRSMSKVEKAPFEAKAAKKKAEYEKLMNAYNKKQKGMADHGDEESDEKMTDDGEEEPDEESMAGDGDEGSGQIFFHSLGLHKPYHSNARLKGATPSNSVAPTTSTPPLVTPKDHANLKKDCSPVTPLDDLLTPAAQSPNHGKESHPNSSLPATSTDLMSEAELERLLSKLEKPVAHSPIDISANEAAVHIQKGLLLSLQLTTDTDRMIIIANGVFSVLRSLSVDFASLYEKVRTFIKYSALLARVADSPNQMSSIEELEAQYHSKKLQCDEVFKLHATISASIDKSNKHITYLEGEISRSRDLLRKLEGKLSLCKSERSSHNSHLIKISEDIKKAKKELQVALDTLDQYKRRRASRNTTQQAFDRAKAALNE